MGNKKRIIAPLAFGTSVIAAAVAVAALTPTSRASDSQVHIRDIQIGERGLQTRIAFLCSSACMLEKQSDGSFLLRGVIDPFKVDLSSRDARVRALSASPAKGGVALTYQAAGQVDYAASKTCTVGGHTASCLDIFFKEQNVAQGPNANIRTPSRKPVVKPTVGDLGDQKTASLQKPPLRETAQERLNAFASLAPPTRLDPPAGAILAKVQPIEKEVEVRKPEIRNVPTIAKPASAPAIAERVSYIMGKNLTPAYCNNAEATLQADAWALGAMTDVGLCAAARGDAAEADEVLARLLQYTPDNYEALVGRALIAEQAGEKGVARKYFQDALNALPPIAESTRIVEAMSSLR